MKQTSRDALDILLEASADGILLVDVNGSILDANQRLLDMLGFESEELIGEPVELLVPEFLRSGHNELRESYMKAPTQRPMGSAIDLKAQAADGSVIPVDISLSPFEVEGELVISTSIRDISKEALLRQQYQSILEAVPDAIIVADPKTGEILEVNEQVTELFGYKPADLIGEPQTSLHPTGEETRYRALFERHSESGQALFTTFPDGSDIEIETAAGERIPVEINARIFEHHELQRIVGVFRDISVRRRYERRLEHEHERLQRILDAIPVPLVLAEFEEDEPRVTWFNDEFEQRFDLTHAELSGVSIDQYITTEDTVAEAQTINRQLVRGEPVRQEVIRRTADGEERTFLLVATPLDLDEENEVIGVYIDITEQQRLLEKRQLLSEVSQTVGEADSFNDGLLGTVEAICRHTRWQYGEVWIPDSSSERVVYGGGCTRDKAIEPFLEASQEYTFNIGEGVPGKIFEHGEPVWFSSVVDAAEYPFLRVALAESSGLHAALAIPLVAGDGEVLAVFIFFMDQPQERDEKLFDDVAEVIAQLDGLAARKHAEQLVHRRNEQLEDFAGVISHDLRNPLSIANGYLELIQEDHESPYTQSIEDALRRMEELIDDLLTLAREGKPIDETEWVELSRCVERCWSNVETKGASLRSLVDDHIKADRSRLEQLFENLIRNAIEHGGDEVTVTVGRLKEGFFLEDDGPGIEPDLRGEILRPGFTTSETGTGFGLSIVREITEAHGWEIGIAEADGGGARFEITGVEFCDQST